MICITLIAFSLFALDQSMDDINFNTFVSLIALLNAVIPTFVYCYYADGLAVDLLRIGDIFYASMWYESRYQEQKLLILSIQRAQKTFQMKGYGIVYCSLEVFAAVSA